MKGQSIFPGILLIGVGLYFLADQIQLPFIQNIFTWPTLLIILGIAFLFQAYLSKDYSSIFSGVIVTGLGVHFHAKELVGFWPDHWAVYTFIIGIAFILRHQKTKSGIVPGIILFIISLLGLFYDGIIGWMSYIGDVFGWIESFWPVALIVAGIYLLFFRKK